MANSRESKLTIIRDIVGLGIPSSMRVARVASPLMGPISAAIEARKFQKQHNPDDLSVKNVKILEDAKGNMIGGAIIWEATWVRESTEQEAKDTIQALMQEIFMQEQADHPRTFPFN